MKHLIYVDLSCTTLEDLKQPQDQLIWVKPGDEDDDDWNIFAMSFASPYVKFVLLVIALICPKITEYLNNVQKYILKQQRITFPHVAKEVYFFWSDIASVKVACELSQTVLRLIF